MCLKMDNNHVKFQNLRHIEGGSCQQYYQTVWNKMYTTKFFILIATSISPKFWICKQKSILTHTHWKTKLDTSWAMAGRLLATAGRVSVCSHTERLNGGDGTNEAVLKHSLNGTLLGIFLPLIRILYRINANAAVNTLVNMFFIFLIFFEGLMFFARVQEIIFDLLLKIWRKNQIYSNYPRINHPVCIE